MAPLVRRRKTKFPTISPLQMKILNTFYPLITSISEFFFQLISWHQQFFSSKFTFKKFLS